jgi:thiol-disulfide isomerase/thioredoxin
MRLPKRIASTLLPLLAIAAFAAFAFVNLVEHRIATHAYAPKFALHPQPAADFTFRTLDGESHRLTDFKGKVVIVNLWGTWCLPCRAEMPTLQRLYDRFHDDPQVKFLIISRLDTPVQVRAYARLNHLDLPFYLMEDSAIPLSMQFQQYPSTFLYAPEGTLVATQIGPADWADTSVIAFIDNLKHR